MARVCLFALAALLAVCPAPFSVAHPDGAPATACEHMTPGHHGIPPQNGPSPYSIQVKNGTSKYGETLDVQITGQDYEGILLIAREVNSTKPLGTWIDTPDNTKVLQCSGIDGSAITHANTKPKTSSTTYHWVAPENNCQQTLIMTATVAKGFPIYWIGITITIHIKPAASCSSSSG
ncbi:putative defense protein 3 isoform X2 [Lissotriton helveticus]